MSQMVFNRIIRLLDDNKVSYQLFEHRPVFTSDEAARVRGTRPEQAAKALFFFGDSKPLMIVLPGNRKVETKNFKKLFRVRDLSLVPPEQVEILTNGVKVGAVPPFGNLFKLPVFVDKSLTINKEIVFNAGLHTRSIKMKYQDFERLVDPTIGDFSKIS